MAATIIFGSLRGTETSDERIRVEEDADLVVKELAASKNGYASFELASKTGGTIWINAAQVRAVRQARNRV